MKIIVEDRSMVNILVTFKIGKALAQLLATVKVSGLTSNILREYQSKAAVSIQRWLHAYKR